MTKAKQTPRNKNKNKNKNEMIGQILMTIQQAASAVNVHLKVDNAVVLCEGFSYSILAGKVFRPLDGQEPRSAADVWQVGDRWINYGVAEEPDIQD